MTIAHQKARASGIRFSKIIEGKEVGRAYLYVMNNDLHAEPFGLLEDVEVNENHRGQGIGKELIRTVISKARELDCYKLIATSRHARVRVHQLYTDLGFENHGLEFRLNF